ncbi:hypothetical protein FisN_11Hu262 [Fistulifera solaris]|uniref:Uncharacterized protein n=1 Tax=Fistulifera solaris TaxID=1519565 RepID=A0A1Z5JLQ8_FISSO|nr:hypothetical protein FisN_11Hu262 [Fistulifera solaris]|eukprot:GAX14721.1 hypothetical protein FisN_11Hu262 [Fistulifera solaris]
MNRLSPHSESALNTNDGLRSTMTRDDPSKTQVRLVSMNSMSHIGLSSTSLPLKKRSLPFESLKELARTKQTSISTNSNNDRTLRAASVFGAPSEAFMKILQKEGMEPVTKKAKETTENEKDISLPALDALHHACRKSPTISELEEILRKDPQAASRPIRLTTTKRVYNIQKGCLEDRTVPEPYQYPLNIAISYQASAEVIERLATAAPAVLTSFDGLAFGKQEHSNLTSLHILLRHQPNDTASVDMMLLKRPSVATLVDRHGNTPLHTAVMHSAALKTIHHLNLFNPDHIKRRNGNGCTPLQLAQSLSFCSQKVVSYLWKELDSRF